LSDLLVFGRRGGEHAASLARDSHRPQISEADVQAAAEEALGPFEQTGGENPYTVHQELQQTMQELVGIIRRADELERALKEIQALKDRAKRVSVEGHRQYNPGWHLALDLRSMLTVAECVTVAALTRKESRGGHTRDDFPKADPEWGKLNIELTEQLGEVRMRTRPLPEMPTELQSLFEESH
jgi:succinate dehydrogenase / fumarate reductase flavoprotein subunit